MAYSDGYAPSNGAKRTLLLLTFLGVIASWLCLLSNSGVDGVRRAILLCCSLVFFLRLVLSILLFVKRKVRWMEGISVGVLYGCMVFFFSSWGTMFQHSFGTIELIGGILFVFGSWINTQADL
jgi:hypothetical protein